MDREEPDRAESAEKYSINVVAIIEGKNVNTNIDPEEPLTQDMRLIVIANRAKLNKLK